MSKHIVEEQHFEKIDFSENPLIKGEYEHCTFVNCVFANADLSDFVFAECEFKGCNMSLAKITRTAFRDVSFIDCKLLGLHFEGCNNFLFAVDFDTCFLNLSSFYKLGLKKMKFKDCSLHEVDFTESDLNTATFDNCDLAHATFDRTNLEKTDFRTSFNYSIDPEANKIKGAKFSLNGIPGLLHRYNIEIEN